MWPLLTCGDWNQVCDSSQDQRGGGPTTKHQRGLFHQWVNRLGWTSQSPEMEVNTFPTLPSGGWSLSVFQSHMIRLICHDWLHLLTPVLSRSKTFEDFGSPGLSVYRPWWGGGLWEPWSLWGGGLTGWFTKWQTLTFVLCCFWGLDVCVSLLLCFFVGVPAVI